MSPAPAKVCPLCGFKDCETISQRRSADVSSADDSHLLNQSQQIEAVARLLAKSQSTLICGLDCLDSDAQMAAWRIADQVRAIVDSSLTNSSHAAIQSMQRYGKVAATYGEVRSRSDLLVFWDCDLRPQHACLLRLITSRCVAERKIAFVGPADSPMTEFADFVFAVNTTENRNAMIRLICRLRAHGRRSIAAGR